MEKSETTYVESLPQDDFDEEEGLNNVSNL